MVDGGNQVVDEDNTTQIISKNAIRYRGYYYDKETKLYYLQSRYYNPDVGRFLNADGMLNGNGDILGFNMFAYCGNNPVMGYDPFGAFDLGIITDWATTAIAAISSFYVGMKTAVTTFCSTLSLKAAIVTGTASAFATFGAINNAVNAAYYNYISDGESSILENDPKNSDYVDEYITRWDRLDYTKKMTQETSYNTNAWRFYSEYSFHMYGWYLTSWAIGKRVPKISGYAQSCQKADVSAYEWDSRSYVNFGTAVFGFLGL